jgi:predicted DNA-binding transcriptional regulator YafY
VPLLHTHFGQRAVHEASVDQVRSRVRITAPTEQLLARGLAGWAEYLEVEEPASLRAELLRLGRALVERNGGSSVVE